MIARRIGHIRFAVSEHGKLTGVAVPLDGP